MDGYGIECVRPLPFPLNLKSAKTNSRQSMLTRLGFMHQPQTAPRPVMRLFGYR